MPIVNLTNDQKAQLVGWLNRENDFLLSMKSMGERCIIPRATGTLELVSNDYEWIQRVRRSIKESTEGVDVSEQDIETLVEIARSNKYSDRETFWRGIVEQCGGASFKMRDYR